MFNLFEYLETIAPEVPEIGAVYKASGISRMEDLLANLRTAQDCCVVARDSGNGHLNLKDRRLDTGYQMFYCFYRAKLNDHTKILQAKRSAMATAIKLLAQFIQDSHEFGDPAYGFDNSRIDYSELGPIAGIYYGYSFGFLVEQKV